MTNVNRSKKEKLPVSWPATTDKPAGYGVVRLPVVTLYGAPNTGGHPINQLLFGEHYQVLDHAADWYHIRNQADQAAGWMPSAHHHAISEEYFHHINSVDFKISTEMLARLLYKKTPLHVVMGSILPISSSELFAADEHFAFAGESKSLGQKRGYEFLHDIALRYLQAPEWPGGRTPLGLDGAAFLQMIFKITGVSLKRTLAEIREQGKKVSAPERQPGDILFFQVGAELRAALLLEGERIIHVRHWVRIEPAPSQSTWQPEEPLPAWEWIDTRRYALARS